MSLSATHVLSCSDVQNLNLTCLNNNKIIRRPYRPMYTIPSGAGNSDFARFQSSYLNSIPARAAPEPKSGRTYRPPTLPLFLLRGLAYLYSTVVSRDRVA